MSTIFVDIEVYYGFFYIGMKREHDGLRIGVESSSRTNYTFDKDYVRKVLLKNITVGFNSFPYDLPLIWYSLQTGVTPDMIKEKSDAIIKGRVKPWEVERLLGIEIPYDVRKNHIDLIEPQPNAIAGLKILNGRMHGKQLQDLPFDPAIRLTEDQMQVVADYCLQNDLDATHSLFDTLKEPLELRQSLGAIYGMDFRSKSDAQIGEAIVKKRVEQMTGRKPERVNTAPGTTFKYPVPNYVEFRTPALKEMLARLRETNFVVNDKGKVEMPEWLSNFKVRIGSSTYSMGIGGLHSTESGRCVKSSDTHVLIDADVASQYPSIIMQLGLAPKSLGDTFLKVYGDIKSDRLKAKKRAKEIKLELPGVNDPTRIAELKAEMAKCQVQDKGAKVSLNGVYGKLGSPYSVLHAPHLMISVTLTGQITLLMLLEKAEESGISVVSGNTDGVLFLCPREKYAGISKERLNPSKIAEITDWWEKTTGFDLEFGEYKAIYNLSVNCYYAIKPDGGHKRKGDIGNPWNKHPDDFDQVRGQLMKNPQATICSDAALNLIKDGTPIEETIRASRDIREFVTVIKSTKGATWRGRYLGKTVRYYWGVGGTEIVGAESNDLGNFNKVPKSDGAIECMRLPDEFPDDIDYDRYIAETESILRDCGYYGDVIEDIKPYRVAKVRKQDFLKKWAMMA